MGWTDAPEVAPKGKWAAAPEVATTKPKATGANMTQDLLDSGAIEVVSTTENGGRVFRDKKTGGLMYSDDAYSTSDPAKIAEIMKGATAAETSMASFDKSTLGQMPKAVTAAAKFVQGVPFVGEYLDEFIGMGRGEEAMGNIRAGQSAMDRQYPKTSMGLQLAGGVTGSIPLALAAGPAIVANAPATLTGKAALSGLVAGISGGLEGLVSGYGAGNEGDRLKSAAQRGAIGTGLGVALGGLAPLGVAGIKSLAAQWKGRDTSIIARVLGVDKKTAEMLKTGLAADDPAKALAALDRAGPDAMLADAGPGMSNLLDTSIQSSGSAARIASERIGERAANAAKRIAGTFDGLLGKADVGIKTAAKSIAERTSKLRSAAYEKAFARPIDYSSAAGMAIDDVVARTPSDILGKAIKGANDAMKIEGRTGLQIMASIADDGAVTFTKPLDVFQLNELKKSLGEIGRAAVDQFGRPTGEGRRIKSLEVGLAKALGDAVPEYRAAVRAGGDKIAEDRALDLGRKMLSPATTREAVIEEMRGASKDAIAAAKRGLRSYIDETMANVRGVISDPNVDAREALAMVKALSSRASRDKVSVILGKKADMLFDALEEASAHLELRSAVARNSATAGRLATQDTAKRIVGDTIGDAVNDAEPINMAKRIIQSVTGGSGPRKTEALNNLYTEVAKALTGPRGAEARMAMAVIEKALAGQPIKTRDAEAIARLVTGGGALLGYQSGTQALASRQRAQ